MEPLEVTCRPQVLGGHVHLEVFVGTDADHLQNAGKLIVDVEQAEQVMSLFTRRPYTLAELNAEAGADGIESLQTVRDAVLSCRDKALDGVGVREGAAEAAAYLSHILWWLSMVELVTTDG